MLTCYMTSVNILSWPLQTFTFFPAPKLQIDSISHHDLYCQYKVQPEWRVVQLPLPLFTSVTPILPLLSLSISKALTQPLLITKLHISCVSVWRTTYYGVYTATCSFVHAHLYTLHTLANERLMKIYS